MNWLKNLKGKVRLAEQLSRHTTFKIGGPARLFIEPKDINDLKLLLNFLKRYKISYLVIGAGSNILVDDKGINCAVIRLSAAYFKRMSFDNNYLNAACGVTLNQVVSKAEGRGLSGGEFLTGIPGTVGGGLAMNAGAKGKSLADLVKQVKVMDNNGNIKILDKKDIKFGYRSSSLSKYIILSARLKLVKKDKLEIRNRINKYLDFRRDAQDLSLPSAGCVFKNPGHDSAGRLIDLCGLKGMIIGGASVSLKHANFILNLKHATAADVIKLMGLIKKEVKRKFNVTLKPEIRIWQ